MVLYLSGAITNDPLYVSKFEFIEIELKRNDRKILNPVSIINYLGINDDNKIKEICLGLIKASDFLININDYIKSNQRDYEIQLAKELGIIVHTIEYRHNPHNIKILKHYYPTVEFNVKKNTLFYNDKLSKDFIMYEINKLLPTIAKNYKYFNIYKHYIYYNIFNQQLQIN